MFKMEPIDLHIYWLLFFIFKLKKNYLFIIYMSTSKNIKSKSNKPQKCKENIATIPDDPKPMSPQSITISNDPCGKNGVQLWPSNYGCTKTITPKLVRKGFVMDRFGSENGNFFGDVNDYFVKRSIPYFGVSYQISPDCKNKMKENYYNYYTQNPEQYNMYEVIKPFFMYNCEIGPAFNFPGGGTQYWTSKSVSKLLTEGMIQKIKVDHIPFFDEDDYNEHNNKVKSNSYSNTPILPGGKKRTTKKTKKRDKDKKRQRQNDIIVYSSIISCILKK